MMIGNDAEILTAEELADRLKVSRTTVFSWLKTGVLREGIHYLRLGRILRFRWQDGLFFNSKAMPQDCAAAATLPPSPETAPYKRGRRGKRQKQGNQPTVNLDY